MCLQIFRAHSRGGRKVGFSLTNLFGKKQNEFVIPDISDLPKIGGNLDDYSWGDIDLISRCGKAPEYFDVGMSKKFRIGEEIFISKILDFNHESLEHGVHNYGITFSTSSCIGKHKMESAEPTNKGGWHLSEMKKYLECSIYPKINGELREIIKPVCKVTSKGSKKVKFDVTYDKLWLFSEREVFGNPSFSGFFVGDRDTIHEGEQYPIFKDMNNRCMLLKGKEEPWWLRSPVITSEENYCAVSKTGDFDMGYANMEAGIVFGFCI